MIIITIHKPSKEIFKKWLEILYDLDEREKIKKDKLKNKGRRKTYNNDNERREARNKSRREYYKRNKELEIRKVKEYQKKKKNE